MSRFSSASSWLLGSTFNVLRAAKETVTISYAHKTYQYDVTELPAAQARFQQLCSRSSARQ